MGEDTSNPLGVAGTELVEEGDHGVDDGRGEARSQEQVLVRARTRGDVDDEPVGVVAEGNVQAVEEAGNGRIHRVDSSRMEGDRSFRIGSGEVADRMRQADRVAGCDSGVKEVAAAVQCAHTNNCHGDRTGFGRGAVGLGRSG